MITGWLSGARNPVIAHLMKFRVGKIEKKIKDYRKKLIQFQSALWNTACISKRMGEGKRWGRQRRPTDLSLEISFNFKQLHIFIKCFQRSVKPGCACNEKALFTIKKKSIGVLFSESKNKKKMARERERAISLCLSRLAQGSPVQSKGIKHGLRNMTVFWGRKRICL